MCVYIYILTEARDVVDAVLVEELLVDNPGSIRYDLVDPPLIRCIK